MTIGNKCEEKGQCEKPSVNANGSEATTQVSRSCQNKEQNGGRSQKIYYSSIISVGIGLSSILIGTTILLKVMTSHHWVAKSAFGIWFGFFIFCTGVIGISYSMSKSKKKEHLLVCLNVIAITLTIVSLGCYASATVHYHGVRTGKISTMCSNTSGKSLNGDTENCRKREINTATLFAFLNGFLLVLSGIQCMVCILVMALCSTARDCCVRYFAGNVDRDELWVSVAEAIANTTYFVRTVHIYTIHILYISNQHVKGTNQFRVIGYMQPMLLSETIKASNEREGVAIPLCYIGVAIAKYIHFRKDKKILIKRNKPSFPPLLIAFIILQQSMYSGYPYLLRYSSFTNMHVLFDHNGHGTKVTVKSLETGHKEPMHPVKLKEVKYSDATKQKSQGKYQEHRDGLT